MAQTYFDISECAVCGQLIRSGDDLVSFPPFVANTKDPLYVFNDATFHAHCARSHPLGENAISLSDKFISHTRPTNRICIVSHELIATPEEYVFTGVLTSDETESLSQFNFVTLNRKNIPLWNRREAFVNQLRHFIQQDKWQELSGGNKMLQELLKTFAGEGVNNRS